MGKTISFVKGKGSISHNNRKFVAENVDRDRMDWNIYYKQQDLREAYDQIFGPAIEEYNVKQKRKDRQIKDYLTDIKNSGNKEKQFYEIVVQIGKKEDTGVVDKDGNLTADAKEAKEILEQYMSSFQERNPNLYLFNAVLHMDETTPHLHLDYIPVAHGYKTKMHTRNSLTKALQEMGIAPATSKLDNETMHWQQREREFLTEMCRERSIEVEVLGEKRDNYTIPEYKAARQKADEITAELEILNAEKKESEAEIVLINAQVNSSRDEIADNEHRLEEIKSEISKQEKKFKECEARIDTVLEAEKPVKKELETIQKNSKQLPAILNKEPRVSLPKKDYDHLVKMARSSGTLKRLNETYDRRITKLQEKINTLTSQVNILTDKLLKAEAFMKVKGLLEEFKAFLQPKSIKSLLFTKKRQADEQNKSRERDRNRTKNGMAI